MAKVTVPTNQQAEVFQISPEYVRISMAAAIQLGLKRGRIDRASCNCINLIQNYPEGCYANCSYCGLARERPGLPEENSFIRVAWPLYPADLVAERIAAREAKSEVGRVCISQVQDHRANADLLELVRRVRQQVPQVPIAALVSATLLNQEKLYEIRDAGVDIIGIGLDGTTEKVFDAIRGKQTGSPHRWDQHWRIIRLARSIFGPMNVNCHIIVGMGETDRELFDLFFQLRDEQIAGYLFSFNPEPGTATQDLPRQPIARHRRIQLVKYLIENCELVQASLSYDADGNLLHLDAPAEMVEEAIQSGLPFMTNGCPDRHGVMACNRPYGSYRLGEEFRDYPFLPNADDVAVIREQMSLEEVWAPQPISA
ncbi:MAG TPA: radical SAM protein [Anaerolineaceae bacterium]|nr:radical SAM protein [Anaerolineaceae bacterium]